MKKPKLYLTEECIKEVKPSEKPTSLTMECYTNLPTDRVLQPVIPVISLSQTTIEVEPCDIKVLASEIPRITLTIEQTICPIPIKSPKFMGACQIKVKGIKMPEIPEISGHPALVNPVMPPKFMGSCNIRVKESILPTSLQVIE